MTAQSGSTITASFGTDPSVTKSGPDGQLAHGTTFDHMERLSERFYRVGDVAWCLVGNGLSNQTFIEAPEGLIAIDTGESEQEMAAALRVLRGETDRPVVAVIYSHFHYCNGTTALGSDVPPAATDSLPVWGHEGIVGNRARVTTSVAQAASRGLVHQFGILLPPEGPDGLVGAGIGRFFQNPAHLPGTSGFIAPNQLVTQRTTTRIAGLDVEFSPAPSDADDSLNIFFPSLGLAVNNLLWPALFNVFAIRGEEYRDPTVLLSGIDEIIDFDPEHLIGAHGPPLSGREEVNQAAVSARDAIQFLWDQSVRGINRGLTLSELGEFVQLPADFEGTYFTQQHYGLAEHHTRQIHSGLRGWFDGNEAELFPLPTAERARRMVEGFGGAEAVRQQARDALEADDLRWALELSSWLVRRATPPGGASNDPAGAEEPDRALLAETLRAIAYRTTSANARNWCLTRALEVVGHIDLSRFRTAGFSRRRILEGDPSTFISGLRVLVDPQAASGIDDELRWRITDGGTSGLRIRNCIAVPTDGEAAQLELAMSHDSLANLLGGKSSLDEAVGDGSVVMSGDPERIRAICNCFEITTLRTG